MSSDDDYLIPVQEFQCWHAECIAEDAPISSLPFLREHRMNKDGSVKLDCSFPDESEFSITCPDGYPRATNVAIRTTSPNLAKWCTNINEFINKQSGGVKLAAILTKCVEYFLPKSSPVPMEVDKTPNDSDFEDTDGSPDDKYWNDKGLESEPDELMEDYNFTTQFDIQMDILKKQWIIKEKEFRQKLIEEKERSYKVSSPTPAKLRHVLHLTKSRWPADGNLPSSSKLVKQGDQIFDHESAAFQILCNEMISLIQSGKSSGFACFPIDDCLYKWSVKMNLFPRDSNLTKELSELKQRFGFDFIELQLDFVPDYPFYPPLLRIVRPRFKGSLVQSLANIDLLKLTYWNPAKTVNDVLMSIKEILMKHAKLDLTNEKNDPLLHPEGAYLPLEDYLIKLALASEVRPRANFDIINVENLEKAPAIKIESNEKSTSSLAYPPNYPKGGWKPGVGYGSGMTRSSWTPETYLQATKEKDRQIISVLTNITKELTKYKENVNMKVGDFYSVVEGSSLIPYFEKLLETFIESSIEMSNRIEMYGLVLDIIESLGEISCLLPLFCNLIRQKYCLMAYLEKLRKSAEELKSINLKVKKPKLDHVDPSGKKDDCHDDLEMSNAKKVINVVNKLKEKLINAKLQYSLDAQDVVNKPRDETIDVETIYKAHLKVLQYDQCNFESLKGSSWAHHYYDKCKDAYTSEAKLIWREWGVLRSSLPLSYSTGLFVRYDEDKINLLRALIIGPEDTPYANGCFLFDICFPVGYPEKPPLVNIQTTGGGRVRFNPNLYNNGKVCLSLLGTWSGDKGESWNSKSSTLLQVLISIQSLIMVEQPYFNEPGYETTMGTSEGDKNSLGYNKRIRKDCIQLAMIEMLNSPPPAFENVVKCHFKLKKSCILEQVRKWLTEDSDLKSVVNNLEKALNKLDEFELPLLQ